MVDDENIVIMSDAVAGWADSMIPNRDPRNTGVKLMGEVSELMEAMVYGGDVGDEVADCLILLLDIAWLNNIDISDEFWKKMNINETRKWNIVKGALKHVHPD